jgi:hypothetical protein
LGQGQEYKDKSTEVSFLRCSLISKGFFFFNLCWCFQNAICHFRQASMNFSVFIPQARSKVIWGGHRFLSWALLSFMLYWKARILCSLPSHLCPAWQVQPRADPCFSHPHVTIHLSHLVLAFTLHGLQGWIETPCHRQVSHISWSIWTWSISTQPLTGSCTLTHSSPTTCPSQLVHVCALSLPAIPSPCPAQLAVIREHFTCNQWPFTGLFSAPFPHLAQGTAAGGSISEYPNAQGFSTMPVTTCL